jgi:hypothetical protein
MWMLEATERNRNPYKMDDSTSSNRARRMKVDRHVGGYRWEFEGSGRFSHVVAKVSTWEDYDAEA